MAHSQPRPLRTFLTALLYGAALMSAVSNTALLLLAWPDGGAGWSNVSLGLLGWGIVLYIHRGRGWFPFRRPRGGAGQ